ncbi:hypothetical protein VTN77DRAFT_3521 [Rasamsonia byssochlamydoides]|uniref:uncharacterized protein n=1 Tax=Rasamsonia byssochlamydoides TaxID=89139 RepID=UPI0037443BE0
MASTTKDAAAIEAARAFNNVPWCEDYEKMISGMLYNPVNPTLVLARMRAKRLTMKYNTHLPEDATPESLQADRDQILSQLLGRVGENCYIEPPFHVDYGCNVSIGRNVYANVNLTILDCALVTIGHRVMIGPSVSILAATHETEVQSRRDNIEYARPITIGNDCWIGGNVVLLAGVTIGNGSTIGAGAVVTKDIPPFSVAVGNPARVVRKVTPLPDVD